MRAGERLRIKTQAGPDDLSPATWTGLGTNITNIPSSGSATFALGVDFDCSDYDFEIRIPSGTNVTIHGNGAVLDAARKGRFFTVDSGGTLALDHLTLQHGYVSGIVSAAFIDFGHDAAVSKEPDGHHHSLTKELPLALLLYCYIPALGS